MNVVSINDQRELISKIIDLITLLKLDDSYRIVGRNKDFLIENILLNISGIDINSGEAVKILSKKLKVTNQYVYNYRNFLKSSGWFITTQDGFKLIDYVGFKTLPAAIDFNFRLQLKND